MLSSRNILKFYTHLVPICNNRWRLLQVPPLYELDTTDITKWDENVKNKAIRIIESYCNAVPCEYEPLESCIDEEKKTIDGNSSNYCEICKRIIIGDKTYKIHLNSNKHNKVLKKLNKMNESNKCT